MVTAASPDLEPAWLAQAAAGGIVQVPLALAPGLAFLAQGTVVGGVFDGRLTRPAYFIALRSQDGDGDDRQPSPALPEPEGLEAVTAPWHDWAPRRNPPGGLHFVRCMAFLGWLEGLSLGYRSMAEEGVLFGVGDLVRGNACWLGPGTLRVTGREGQALGERLWGTFLDAGGPWPGEFRLRASATPLADAAAGGAALTFVRHGVRTEQVWTLDQDRLRPAVP
jgi:hypothetical protein